MGILQIFDKFYEEIPAGDNPEPGHIFWVPTPDINEVPIILDIERASPTEHEISSYEIKEITSQHFKRRDRLPIKRLSLTETEELLITKAKKRPVVVLAKIATNKINTLPSGPQKRLAQHLGKPCYLVAPMYSTTNLMNPGTFGPILVARIRALQYLHFFCLPDQKKTDKPGSIVRLDRIFPTYLGRGSKPMEVKIHEEPFEVIQSQLSLLTSGTNHEPYHLIRELAQEALPVELATD